MNDGHILKACKEGTPVFLDNINYSKSQVIESLNRLLENNSKYDKNCKYYAFEKEDDEINIEKGFCIIGTMVIDKENNNIISKSLMNRFVAINIDEYLDINGRNILLKIVKKE